MFRPRPRPAPALAPIDHQGEPILIARRPAMGSVFEVRLSARWPEAARWADQALDTIDALERRLTIYSEDSELARLNAQAADGPIAVSADLFGLLRRCAAWGELSGGAFDVTSGALSRAWGFVKGPRRVPDPDQLAAARARTGWQGLIFDDEARTIRFDRPGLEINLGAIGKGYAVDRAVDGLKRQTFARSGLVHGGYSSLYAMGSPPGQFGSRWPVAVRDPADPDRILGTLRIRNRALGTSACSFQWFEGPDGERYGHILDPRIGRPAPWVGGPQGVTALAPTAEIADALSTALMILGPAWAEGFLRDRPALGALFVLDESPRLRAFNLDPADWQPADALPR